MPGEPAFALGDSLRRRRLALTNKLQSLRNEIDAWTKQAAEPAFAIHRSQIEDVCGTLSELHGLIETEIKTASEGNALSLDAIVGFERKILAALQIWESYRDKLTLRLIATLQNTLALVDELAWEAYRPARDRAVASSAVALEAVREPPLVFPNLRWSPFARSREQHYELDESTGNWDALADLDSWLQALPVPLIGIPWYQMTHLPDAVFIGHEVGHLVEEDLALEELLRAAIRAKFPAVLDEKTQTRVTAWTRYWRSEVFADVYGVLTTGPAYATMLVDTLHADSVATDSQPHTSRPAAQQWDAYPTRALRARLVWETVKQLPVENGNDVFKKRGGDLEALWIAAHPTHAMTEYDGDVSAVVAAILTTPLPTFAPAKDRAAAPLTDVITFSSDMLKGADGDAANALAREPLTQAASRVLFASVATAFLRDPDQFAAVGAQERFRQRLVEKRSQRPRAFTPGAPVIPVAARRKGAAQTLLARLSSVRRS